MAKVAINLILLGLATMAAAWESPAYATDTPVQGSSGGTPFRARCDGYLVGFQGQVGLWVDQFQLICARYDANAGKLVTTGPLQVPIGQSRGSTPTSGSCPPGWVVNAIGFRLRAIENDTPRAKVLHSITLECVTLAGGAPYSAQFGSTAPAAQPNGTFGYVFPEDYDVACPRGQIATGMAGRAGLYVDALGLVCAAAPKLPPRPIVSNLQDPGKTGVGIAPSSGVAALGGSSGAGQSPSAGGIGAPSAGATALGGPSGAAQNQGVFGTGPSGGVAALRSPNGALAVPTPYQSIGPVQPSTTASPPTAPAGFAFACQGGGGMTASLNGDLVTITFASAAAGFAAKPVARGQCAFADRGLRPGEPLMLVYRGDRAAALFNQARSGGTFQVHSFNNSQGALVVSSIDALPPVAPAVIPLSPVGPSVAPVQPAGFSTATVLQAVNVRSGPDMKSKALGVINGGTQVSVAGCEAGWCRLAQPAGSQTGWVAQQFLRFGPQGGAASIVVPAG